MVQDPGTRSDTSSVGIHQRADVDLTCQIGSGSLLARQISPQLLSDSHVGQGLGAGRSPTATPPVNSKRRSAGSIWPASTCRPDATPNANSSLSFSNKDLQQVSKNIMGESSHKYQVSMCSSSHHSLWLCISSAYDTSNGLPIARHSFMACWKHLPAYILVQEEGEVVIEQLQADFQILALG